MKNNFPMTEAEFETWLKSFSPREIVGAQGHTVWCPIATAANNVGRNRHKGIRVTGECWHYVGMRNDDHELPERFHRFLTLIDTAKLPENDRRVTAQRALKAWAEAGRKS